MGHKIPKPIQWFAKIFSKSWSDIVKAYNVTETLQKIVVYFALVIVASSIGFGIYAFALSNLQEGIKIAISVIVPVFIVLTFNAFFISPYRLYSEIGGLDDGLKITEYTSPIGQHGEHIIGLSILPQIPMSSRVFAVVEKVFYNYTGQWIPFTLDPPRPLIDWIDNGNVDGQFINLGRGDIGYLALFQVQPGGRIYANFHKNRRDFPHGCDIVLSVWFYGKKSDGKDFLSEKRIIRIDSKKYAPEIITHPTKRAVDERDSAEIYRLFSTPEVNPAPKPNLVPPFRH